MQTTAIGTVANSLPESEVISLTLLISKRYILFAELRNKNKISLILPPERLWKRTDYLNITELSGHFLSVSTITTDYNHATITLSP